MDARVSGSASRGHLINLMSAGASAQGFQSKDPKAISTSAGARTGELIEVGKLIIFIIPRAIGV